MTHIDDWMDTPPITEQEGLIKEFFKHCRQPAMNVDHRWLGNRVVTCEYGMVTYRCTGASRMGDVWLAEDMTRTHGYNLRVDVDECSNWKITILSKEPPKEHPYE